MTPDGVAACSANFYFSGKCTGGDVTATFSGPHAVSGGSGASVWAGLAPWETNSISILGEAITFIGAVPGWQYAFSGNSYQPDPMLWAQAGSGSTEKFWNGMSFQLPGSIAGSSYHIDMHVGCANAGEPFQGFLSVYYKINPY